MTVLLKGVKTSVILTIMEIVVFRQRWVLQHHGSEIVPDHVIFQDPREGGKEKLGLEWNAKKTGLQVYVPQNSMAPQNIHRY